MLDQITPMVITFNEAPNIQRTLEKLSWARDILVVDSFSNDETLKLVSQHKQARLMSHKFESFADQCNYGLADGGIATEWVLNLDADYVLTDAFVDELKRLNPSESIRGYSSEFVYCINGRPIRSGIYPPVTVLFRKEHARFQPDGHAHRVEVDGRIETLNSAILHDDRKPLTRWFESQSKYTEQEAIKLLGTDRSSLSMNDRVRKLRIVAPAAMLFYCLILRIGVLDGWPGFYYAFQRTIAELMLSLRLLEADCERARRRGYL